MNDESDITVKDTAAYKITRQVMDHTWGSDEKLSSREFVNIYRFFVHIGGSWEKLMDGDMKSVKKLEDSIDTFVKTRNNQ